MWQLLGVHRKRVVILVVLGLITLLMSGCALFNKPPQAAFTFNPTEPVTGTAVTFDASGSSDPDGSIVKYSWEFGDGSIGSGMAPSHVYSRADVYTVKLTVTDNWGGSDSVSHDVEVKESSGPPPPPSFRSGGTCVHR